MSRISTTIWYATKTVYVNFLFIGKTEIFTKNLGQQSQDADAFSSGFK